MRDYVVTCDLFKKICKQFFLKNRSLDFMDKTKVRNLVQRLEIRYED